MTGRSTYSWAGPYFGLIFAALVAHAIIRHRLMDLRLVIHRGLTYAIAAILSLLPVSLILMLAWPRLVGHLQPGELVVLLLAVLVVGLLIPITRDAAGRLLDRYVYRTRANHQRTLREASRALTRVLDLKKLLAFISHTVGASTVAEGTAVYLRENDGLRRQIALGPEGSSFAAPDFAPSSLVEALESTRDLLLLEELERETLTPTRRRVVDDLAPLGWALVLPIIAEDVLIGAIVAGPKRSGDPFYPEDLDLLTTLANHAGIAIKNATLYDQVVLVNEHLQNIVAAIESGVVAVDASGRLTMFNRAAERFTGLSADVILDGPAARLPSALADALARCLAVVEPQREPELLLPPNDLPVICTISPLRGPEGAVLGAVAVFSDLTPLRELEAERRRAERLAYLGLFAAGIAHEIKNPLVAIKTFGQLLPRRRNDERFIDEFGRIVPREIARIERLLEQLRTLSRADNRPHRLLDLRAPLADAGEVMRGPCDEKGVTLTVAAGEVPRLVTGDHAELEQLFLNLLMNALDATPPRGAIRAELQVVGNSVTVAVIDSGAGVPAELRDRIFDPFVTTKPHGSGLGLAICAAIVQTHGARLTAATRPGEGATFTADFPLAVASAVPNPA